MEASKLKQHENLTGTNSLIVRQNRFDSGELLFAEINGDQLNVKNYSLFGLSIVSSKRLEVGELLPEVKLVCSGQHMVSIPFIVRRVAPVGDAFEIGIETINESLPVITISRLLDFQKLINTISEKENHYSGVPDKFKLILSELVLKLEQYEKYVKRFTPDEFETGKEYEEASEALISIVSSKMKSEMETAVFGLAQNVDLNDQATLKSAFDLFREKLGRFIFQSPFTKRSFEKPRGYAGDFVMMKQIYANDAYAGSLFGRCMEKAIQQAGEPSAVRNRSRFLCKKIIGFVKTRKTPVSIMSLAAGPGEEIRLAVEVLTQTELDMCAFTLIDQDEAALQYAQKNILEYAYSINKRVKLNMVNRGIKEILVGGLGDTKFDLIYSAGLFDYFTDSVASRAFKMLTHSLTSTGKIIIGNFNIATTNWFAMLAFFDWNLILRSENDFKRIFFAPNFKMSIESEDQNINLFCCVERE